MTLQPPNIVNRQEILSYIIGYIDGDGSIYNTWNKLALNIVGTHSVLEWISRQFDMNNKPKVTTGQHFSITFCGDGCRKILRELKNHTEKHGLKPLKRKWDKVIDEKLNSRVLGKCWNISAKEVYNAVTIDKKSYNELARELNCSVGTIKNRMKEYRGNI